MQNEIDIQIPFYDVDPMQVVWHGNYIKYMEQGRCALLESIHLTYTDMERMGYAFPVVSLKVKYIKPCIFGQIITLTTTLIPCDNMLIFKYIIKDKNSGQKLCSAETRQMAVDLKNRCSLYELPANILQIIKENN